MLLLLTATIQPQNVVSLKLNDAAERLRQYLDALYFYISLQLFDKIVFCENSDYEYDYSEINKYAVQNHVCLEILRFSADSFAIAQHGRGFGEGEIVNYTMEHSELFQGEDYFYKITGRLKIANIKKIIECEKNLDRTCFVRNLYECDMVDTRFWGMKISTYKEYFSNAYLRVNDSMGKFLEKCYCNTLKYNGLEYYPHKCFPIFVGYSGGLGTQYCECVGILGEFMKIACKTGTFNNKFIFSIIYIWFQKKNRNKTIKEAYFEILKRSD